MRKNSNLQSFVWISK